MRRRRDDEFPDNGFEAWGGYMQAKIAKLEEQFTDRPDLSRKSNIFQGISIYVNGYTNPSAGELKLLMAEHGGVYHTYQRSTDYVIASNLPDTKVKRLTTARVVRPDWITESLAAGSLLDYKQYLLYSKHTRTQLQLPFHKLDHHTSATLATVSTEPHFDESKYSEDVIKLHDMNIQSESVPETNVPNKDIQHDSETVVTTIKDINIPLAPECVTIRGTNIELRPESINKMPNMSIYPELECVTKMEVTPTNVQNRSSEPVIEEHYSSKPDQKIYSETKEPGQLSSEGMVPKPTDELNSEESKTGSTTRTAVDPRFLSEFYSNSRLHHISQLGAGFKQYVNELREASDFVFPARTELMKLINNLEHPDEVPITAVHFKESKVIMHIDMDCFFVSVGLRSRPELRGLPVAVTHAVGARQRAPPRPGVDRRTEFNLYRQKKAKSLSKATGQSEETLLENNAMNTRVDDLSDEGDTFSSMSEIASCSYEAREKGVRNGMFMGAALRLCPDLKTIPYDFDGYKEVAYTLYNTVAKYTLDIEAVSCDEMYVECTELVSALGVSARRLARALRHEIGLRTGCACSAGFGGNRLQARLATKRAKPNGQFFLTAELVESFMMDIKLEELPGVGRQLVQRLASACAGATCGALRALPLAALQRHLGPAAGRQLYLQCRGDDPKPLTFLTVRKSVSAEVNYGIRFENQDQCETFLRQLCCEVQDRMKKSKVVGKSITLKLMVRAAGAPVETAKFMGHGFCDTVNKTATLPVATDDLQVITREVLLLSAKHNRDPKEMRGVGIQVTKLESSLGRQLNKNALKAFLIKPAAKNKRESSNGQETGKDLLEIDIDRISNRETESSNEVGNVIPNELRTENVAGLIPRTPTKAVIDEGVTLHNRDKTPVKLIQLRSPTAIKRSPAKSPAKKKSLGLTGRRRGRPPKSATNTAKSATSASKVLMDKFLMGDRPRTEPICAASLDPEILAALPEDIRQEVMEYYQVNNISEERSRPSTPPTLSKPEERKPSAETTSFVHTTTPDEGCDASRAERSQDGGLGPAEERDPLRVPGRQVRRMLGAWLASGAVPLACDAALLSSYMQRMVLARTLDPLLVLINYFKRNVGQKQDTAWSDVYNQILDGIQQTMTAVYGKPLLID